MTHESLLPVRCLNTPHHAARLSSVNNVSGNHPSPAEAGATDFDVVVVSHLWWDWVWQRPQQLISRLARRHRVLWAEEPHIEIGDPEELFDVKERLPGLLVSRLIYRSDRATFWQRLQDVTREVSGEPFAVSESVVEASLMFESWAQPRLEEEVARYVRGWRGDRPCVLWLYTPLGVPFIELVRPELVVYDVMDELSAFRHAPRRLVSLERELLARADLVFAGGPSIARTKQAVRPDVHLFPSGVDAEHFGRALDPALPVPAAVAGLARPIIGYFGVIDERIDLLLLREIAEARADWQLVMVGPVLKVREAELPRAPNIHYVGKQPYEALPAYLKTFDVALLPFALNEATLHISPTKTLEYLAAQKPVVSTPIADVVSLYGSAVTVAQDHAGFIRGVEAALAEGPDEHAQRAARGQEFLTRYSWDEIAGQMEALIAESLVVR